MATPGAGSATSPPATSPPGGGLLHPANAMMSHGPSPLAMSPPMTAMDDDAEGEDDDEMDVPPTPSQAGPKIKFMLKKS